MACRNVCQNCFETILCGLAHVLLPTQMFSSSQPSDVLVLGVRVRHWRSVVHGFIPWFDTHGALVCHWLMVTGTEKGSQTEQATSRNSQEMLTTLHQVAGNPNPHTHRAYHQIDQHVDVIYWLPGQNRVAAPSSRHLCWVQILIETRQFMLCLSNTTVYTHSKNTDDPAQLDTITQA